MVYVKEMTMRVLSELVDMDLLDPESEATFFSRLLPRQGTAVTGKIYDLFLKASLEVRPCPPATQ
jgi:hypothetical protein